MSVWKVVVLAAAATIARWVITDWWNARKEEV